MFEVRRAIRNDFVNVLELYKKVAAMEVGIARRIEQISGDVVQLNQGTIYPALLQLEQMGWIKSKWGASENNRRAKYYSITRRGLKQLTAEEESWRRTSEVILRFLAPAEEK